ncbi:MAG: ABC transporter permease [Bacteroidota bacterium]
MNEIAGISWINLSLGYVLLIIPLFLLWYFQTGLVKDTIIALARMTIQLSLVGVYLKFLFDLNAGWLNVTWVFVMLVVATFSVTKRSELKQRMFFLPVFLAVFLSVLLIDAFFLGVVIKLPNVYDARYLIPITGMIIGNTLKSNIMALNSFYSEVSKNQEYYQFSLANGATRREATGPYISKALRQAFNPTIATMSVVGIISLPGMMTGQILGGSDPDVAVRYQIMIMISIFIVGTLSAMLSIIFSNMVVFDAYDKFKENPMRK